MRKSVSILAFGAVLACASVSGVSAELRVGTNDSVETVLTAQKGKRVAVRVRSGQEITGTVRDVNGKLVQLGAIAGKEYYDAVIPLSVIDAVIVRTKE
jgi:hypothetical protein